MKQVKTTKIFMLTTNDHSRDIEGLKYIYPVISRRADGLSIGINLNTNNACNWRCIYCQVPGLQRGSAPTVDLKILEQELRNFITSIIHGDFYARHRVPQEGRIIRDIAISGNGEPTSADEFEHVIELIGNVIREMNLANKIKTVLITNGSLVQRDNVQKGINQISELNGEIWFKLDSATDVGMQHINNVNMSITSVFKNLDIVSKLCPTWIQTCVFCLDDNPPSENECESYIQFIKKIVGDGTPIKGILLYGIARPSMQAEAPRLSRLPLEWLENYAAEISQSGIDVKVCE